eukprot:1141689-Pelagomonas_calceolata.AAC.4
MQGWNLKLNGALQGPVRFEPAIPTIKASPPPPPPHSLLLLQQLVLLYLLPWLPGASLPAPGPLCA